MIIEPDPTETILIEVKKCSSYALVPLVKKTSITLGKECIGLRIE